MSEPLTLPVNCRHCGGHVALQSADVVDGRNPAEQAWFCPYCQTANHLISPWLVHWVARPAESKARH